MERFIAEKHPYVEQIKSEILLEPLPAPKNVSPELAAAQETARVLCGVCGDYFEMDVPPYRPVGVDCLACGSQLRISGHERTAAPVNDVANDTVLYLRIDESGGGDTDAKPELTTTATPGLTDTATNALGQLTAGSVTESDGAAPVITAATTATSSPGG